LAVGSWGNYPAVTRPPLQLLADPAPKSSANLKRWIILKPFDIPAGFMFHVIP
jgi:hypothetical protein